jgi:hypothetical protein
VRKLLRIAARKGAPANVGSSSSSSNRNSVTGSSGAGCSPELAALAAARAALQKLLLDAAGMLYLPAAQSGQKVVKALCTLRVCDASRLYSGCVNSCRTLPKYVCRPVEANVLKGIDVLYLTPASAAALR